MSSKSVILTEACSKDAPTSERKSLDELEEYAYKAGLNFNSFTLLAIKEGYNVEEFNSWLSAASQKEVPD